MRKKIKEDVDLPGTPQGLEPGIAIHVLSGTDTTFGKTQSGVEDEHHIELGWAETDEMTLHDLFFELVPAATLSSIGHGEVNIYTLCDQMIAAAKAQPDSVFAVRAGAVDLPLYLKFSSAEQKLLVGAESSPSGEGFSSVIGVDGDNDEDDEEDGGKLNAPGEPVESTVSRLLLPVRKAIPVRDALGWRVAVPRSRRSRGLSEDISEMAVEFLTSLPRRSVTIREGDETHQIIFRFEEDAVEFTRQLAESGPVDVRAEEIALRLLRS
jgi:hypothetical protein